MPLYEKITQAAEFITPYLFTKKNYNGAKVIFSLTLDLASGILNIVLPFVVYVKAKELNAANKTNLDLDDPRDQSIIIAIFGLFAVQNINKAKNRLLSSTRSNIQKELALALVKKCHEREFDQYVTARGSDYTTILSKIYSSIDKAIAAFFPEVFPTVLDILGIIIFLTIKFPYIGLAEIGVTFLYGFVARMNQISAIEVREECVKKSFESYAMITDSVNNYLIAHQNGNIDYEQKKANDALSTTEIAQRENHLKDDNSALSLSIINGFGYVGVVLITLYTNGNKFDQYDFTLIAYFTTRLFNHFDKLPPALNAFCTGVIDSERMIKFLNAKSNVKDIENPITLDSKDSLKIEFKKVSFSYPSKNDAEKPRLILDNVSFVIDANQKFGIAGPTGVGKSTILKLLYRFYTPTAGEIFINSINIKRYSLKSLRAHIAYVGQDANIFNATIEENIKYGDRLAYNSELRQAARFAKLIEAKEYSKLQTEAGANGNKLSGGEKQRTSIARALLKGGKLLCLDEPTSALDPKTASDVQDIIDDLSTTTTVMMVTHILNSLQNANWIVYLDNSGKIIEEGNFETLLAKKGKFYNQYEIQNKPEEKMTVTKTGVDTELVAFWQSRKQGRLKIITNPTSSSHTSTTETALFTTPLLSSELSLQ